MTQTSDPRSLLYRPGLLTPEEAQRLTANALGACDDGELYLQFIASESFGFDDGRLKTADYSRDAGFGLRGVSGEMTGFAHANEISAAAIARAGETLKLLDPAKGAAAPPPRQNNRHLYTEASPLDAVPFAAKVALLEAIDAAARARDPRVAQVSASLAASWSVVEIVRADGFVAQDVRPLVRLNVSIVAEQGGRRERLKPRKQGTSYAASSRGRSRGGVSIPPQPCPSTSACRGGRDRGVRSQPRMGKASVDRYSKSSTRKPGSETAEACRRESGSTVRARR